MLDLNVPEAYVRHALEHQHKADLYCGITTCPTLMVVMPALKRPMKP